MLQLKLRLVKGYFVNNRIVNRTIKNVSLTADEKKKEGNGGETNLSAEEKQRKERIRIQQEYQQSELDLMDEGLGKELAKIRLNYTKRIAAVKEIPKKRLKRGKIWLSPWKMSSPKRSIRIIKIKRRLTYKTVWRLFLLILKRN